MVGGVSPVLLVDELTALFHILGHARGATAKHPNLPDLIGEGNVKPSSVFMERQARVLGGDSFHVSDKGSLRTLCGEGWLGVCV